MLVGDLRKALTDLDAQNSNAAVVVVWPGDGSVGIPTGMWNVEQIRITPESGCILTATVDGELTVGWMLLALTGVRDDTDVSIAIPGTLEGGEFAETKDAYVEADGPFEYGDHVPDPYVVIVIQD